MAGQLSRRTGGDVCGFTPLDRIFENFFREPVLTRELAPVFEEGILAVDVSEDAESVIVRASLPGVKREDVSVEVHDGVVNISAHRSEEHEEKQEKYYRKERREGSVSRRIALPVAVLDDQASAELKEGELTLRLPKARQGGPRKVSVG